MPANTEAVATDGVTLADVYFAMHEFNARVAPRGECGAWQDFVADCWSAFGVTRGRISIWDDEIDPIFAEFWLRVARGDCSVYDPNTGAFVSL
ncbi:MAG: hypothetical protein KDI55_00285 [Anaerolineae bacterium]|mgnify:CR=1 FL=1|nr:hypothetical protein [Anaerolineae bacterium]